MRAGLEASPLWNYSRAGYRMAAGAAAVLSAWEGHRPEVEVEPDPRALVGFIEHMARLQAIKCSPRDDDAGAPTRAMERQCPPRYLHHELALLAPGGLLALGSVPRWAVASGFEVSLEVDEPTFARGTVTIAAQQAEYFWIPHPNNRRGGWARGQRQLIDHLTAHP
jgi:uracil-DNA glycosylase